MALQVAQTAEEDQEERDEQLSFTKVQTLSSFSMKALFKIQTHTGVTDVF